ncbi:MAG: hypothetical protein ACLFSQ_08370 [Candidatus Zixiibacteriota bacterium]
MRRLILIIVIASIAFCQGPTGTVLKANPFARDAALGEAGYALPARDASMVLSNPSQMTTLKTMGLSASYIDWFADSKIGYLSMYHRLMHRRLFLGLGGMFYTVPEWDNDNWMDGGGQPAIDATEFSGRLALSYRFTQPSSPNNVSLGINGDFFNSTIGSYSAYGLGVGGGLVYSWQNRVYISAMLDRFTVIKPDFVTGGNEENLPQNLNFGASYVFDMPGFFSGIGLLAGSRYSLNDGRFDYSMGIETYLGNNFAFRIGAMEGGKRPHAVGAGIGTKFNMGKNVLKLDYSYSPYRDDIAYADLSAHRVTLSFDNERLPQFNLVSIPDGTEYEVANEDTIEVSLCWEARKRWNDDFRYDYTIKVTNDPYMSRDEVFDTTISESTIAGKGQIIPAKLCFDMAIYPSDLDTTEYYWTVVSSDSGKEKQEAKNAPWSFTRIDTLYDKCPPKIDELYVENDKLELHSAQQYITESPALPIVFFDQGSSEIVSPREHKAITDPDWGMQIEPIDEQCIRRVPYHYYDTLFALFASELKNNPDVALVLKSYTSHEKNPDLDLMINRSQNVKEAITKMGVSGSRIIIENFDNYNPKVKRAYNHPHNNQRQSNAVKDDNSRVEIGARLPEHSMYEAIIRYPQYEFGTELPKTELDASTIRKVKNDSQFKQILNANKSVSLVIQVNVNPDYTTSDLGSWRKREYLAMEYGYALGYEYADSLSSKLGIPKDRIQVWIVKDYDQKKDGMKTQVYMTADEIIYMPMKHRYTELTEESQKQVKDNPAIIKPDVKMHCRDSRDRFDSWKLEILNSDDKVISLLDKGKDVDKLKQLYRDGIEWDWLLKDESLCDFNVPYYARFIIKYDNNKADTSTYGPLLIDVEYAGREEMVLISLHHFDKAVPLSMTMRNRADPAAAKFVSDKIDEWKSRREMLIDAEYIFEGHACILGDSSYNRRLSVERSEDERDNFIRILKSTDDYVEALDSLYGKRWLEMLQADLTSKGLGVREPIADNRIPEGRALNRSVYLNIIMEKQSKTPAHFARMYIYDCDSLSAAGNIEAAIAKLDSIDFDKLDNAEVKAEVLFKKIDICEKDKEKINILNKFKAIRNDIKEEAELMIKLAGLEMELKRYDMALDYMELAVAQNPDNANLYYQMGLVNLKFFQEKGQKSNLDKALKNFQETVKKDPAHYKAKKKMLAIEEIMFELKDM